MKPPLKTRVKRDKDIKEAFAKWIDRNLIKGEKVIVKTSEISFTVMKRDFVFAYKAVSTKPNKK